jgi:hypothetical protein
MAHAQDSITLLLQDLQRIFGARLRSVVRYGERARAAAGADKAPVHTMAMVDRLTLEDLGACAAASPSWHKWQLAVPLIIPAAELAAGLDAFPREYAEISGDYGVLVGEDPFAGAQIDQEALRHECEVQARSHLLHLRQGYVAAGGKGKPLAQLVAASAPALAALLRNLARLDGVSLHEHGAVADHTARRLSVDDRVLGDVLALTDTSRRLTPESASRIFPAYLDAMERLAAYVDAWRA